MKTEPKPLNPWQIEDASRLKALFANLEPQISQAELGSKFELGTQGMVSQYLLAPPAEHQGIIRFRARPRRIGGGFQSNHCGKIHQASQTAGISVIQGTRRVTDDEDHAPAQVAIRMVLMRVHAGDR